MLPYTSSLVKSIVYNSRERICNRIDYSESKTQWIKETNVLRIRHFEETEEEWTGKRKVELTARLTMMCSGSNRSVAVPDFGNASRGSGRSSSQAGA